MSRRTALIAGAAIALFSAILATACSGGDEPLTAEQAAAIVQAGLLTEEDLPSVDWTITDGPGEEDASDEDVSDPTEMFGESEACKDLAQAFIELGGSAGDAGEGGAAEDESDALAEAERAFEFGGDESLVIRNVQSSVSVLGTDEEVDAAFELLQEVMTADAMRPCFESIFTEALAGGEEAGVTISSLDISDPETLVNEDAVGIAMDLEAIAFIIPINLHLEMHFWPEGPAAGQLLFMEMNSETLQDAAPEIIEAAGTRLAEAVKANR